MPIRIYRIRLTTPTINRPTKVNICSNDIVYQATCIYANHSSKPLDAPQPQNAEQSLNHRETYHLFFFSISNRNLQVFSFGHLALTAMNLSRFPLSNLPHFKSSTVRGVTIGLRKA